MSRLATGITVVSVLADGQRHGMTVNSFTSVSLDPLLVLFCCEHEAAIHEPLLEAGAWAVSMLAADQDDVSRWFATHERAGEDQFDGQPTRPGPHTGAPLLSEGLAWLECRTWATYDGGDHTIVVGEVVGLEVAERDDPLVYYRGAYGTVKLS